MMFRERLMRSTQFYLPFVAPPVFALLTYALSLGNGFAMIDDGLLIFENNLIREISPATLRTAFTSYDPELYIPLTFVSYQIDYLIGGLHPFMYHLTNLLLHAGSSFLVAACAFLLFSDRRIAIAAGLLFAVHPLHSEAIAWAAARKDVLSAFFFLLSLNCYILREWKVKSEKWETSNKIFDSSLYTLHSSLFLLSIFLFLLALLSKVTAVTLPVILLLVDWFLGRRDYKRMVLEKIPYFLLSFLFGIIALGGKNSLIAERSLFEMILIACKTTVFSLFKILFPLRLSVFYPELSPVTVTNPFILLSILLIASGIVSLWFLRKHRFILFGALFFFITLAPAFLTVVKGGNTFFFSDRYAYLPSIGILFIACILLHGIFRSKFSTILAVVLLLFAVRAARESLIWGDGVRLFERSTRLYPGFYLDHINLGASLREKGRREEAIQ